MRLTRRALFAGIAGIFGAKAVPAETPKRVDSGYILSQECIAKIRDAMRRFDEIECEALLSWKNQYTINECRELFNLKPLSFGDFATKDLRPLFKKLEARIESASIRNRSKA